MLNENAKKWIAALRSGEHKQAKFALTKKDESGWSHCCLGVACVLYQKEVGGLTVESPLESIGVSHNGDSQYLPEVVAKWLGVANPKAQWGLADDFSLPRFNDSQRRSFTEIADIIESEPTGLFV